MQEYRKKVKEYFSQSEMLIDLGWVRQESIWLEVMTCGPWFTLSLLYVIKPSGFPSLSACP